MALASRERERGREGGRARDMVRVVRMRGKGCARMLPEMSQVD